MLKGLDSGKKVSKALSFFILVAVSVLMIIPLVWGVAGSFRTSNDVLANPEKFFPSDWDAFTFDGYKELFSKAEFNSTTPNEWYPIWNWLFNSLIVALGGTLLYLVIAALAAYAFVFLDFKYANKIFYFLICTMTIPGIVSTTPQLINMNLLNAYKSLAGLILPSLGGVYGVFLIRQFFVGIPKDLVENARIDGASNMKIFFKILIIGGAPRSTWTLAYGLKVISDQSEAYESMTLALASAVIAMIPIFIVYLIAQSKIIEGVANTGIKR